MNPFAAAAADSHPGSGGDGRRQPVRWAAVTISSQVNQNPTLIDAFVKSRVHPSIPQGERFQATVSD
jgi:hypothetical protein